ncbi:uncharacterized mitochondrial protein AtMg00810-like [Nicotiana tomentosiformis]|uniref:uncharacterized mitochondrial protein AtMg00810-like n=1 Tax=Nicotiana tomentosiformis TaxID=4098 RepID=UPI00388C4CE8
MGGRRKFHGAKELLLPDHYDVRIAHNVVGKCNVHSFRNYTKLENVGPEDYYCQFKYKTTTGAFVPDMVPMYCKCEMPYNPDDFMVNNIDENSQSVTPAVLLKFLREHRSVWLYVDDLIFTGNNPSLFETFKKDISRKFEMTDVGLMSYYLGLEVKQMEDGFFISQESYTKEILKKFNMLDCNPVNTLMESGTKLSKFDEGENVDPTFFKSLVGRLRYLTCIRSDILFAVVVVRRFMEAPTSTHLKVTRRILRYLKGTIDIGLFYSSSNDFNLMGFCGSDYVRDIDDRKSTTGFVFFLGDSVISWSSKKQSIVTLSTCEAEYIAATSCTCYAIWLRRLLKELNLPQIEAT